MRRAVFVIATLLLVSSVACNERGGRASKPAAPTAPTVYGTATVSGTVTFAGEAPPAEVVEASQCHAGGARIEVRPVHVDDNGRLRDVVVFVKGAAPSAGGETAAPVVLDQVNCEYVPHAVALRVGQVLRVRSSDPTLHNVHGLPTENAAFNFGMTASGQQRDLTFDAAEQFKVKCDVHPWMSASVNVFDHPFYTVTNADGSYELKNLPAGTHTLVFRHDFLGEKEVTVTAVEGRAVEANAGFGREK